MYIPMVSLPDLGFLISPHITIPVTLFFILGAFAAHRLAYCYRQKLYMSFTSERLEALSVLLLLLSAYPLIVSGIYAGYWLPRSIPFPFSVAVLFSFIIYGLVWIAWYLDKTKHKVDVTKVKRIYKLPSGPHSLAYLYMILRRTEYMHFPAGYAWLAIAICFLALIPLHNIVSEVFRNLVSLIFCVLLFIVVPFFRGLYHQIYLAKGRVVIVMNAFWLRCAKCGYNMRGIESGVCPECGYIYQRGKFRRTYAIQHNHPPTVSG